MNCFTYFGHIWVPGNLERSNRTPTPGGRAGSSLSTDTPGYSSVQMFLEDKLREGEFYQCMNGLMKPAKCLLFPNVLKAEVGPAALTLLAAVSSESRRTAAVSRDVVAGRSLSTAAALRAALSEHTRQTR